MATVMLKRIRADRFSGSIPAGMGRLFIESICFRLKQPKSKHPNKPMKNIKQKLGLAAALLAGSLAVASADPVVFNVNMSVQSALGNFNAGNGDGVRVLRSEERRVGKECRS